MGLLNYYNIFDKNPARETISGQFIWNMSGEVKVWSTVFKHIAVWEKAGVGDIF